MTAVNLYVPEHVPPHLVVDIDIYDPPGGHQDPQLAWVGIGPEAPAIWSPRNGGHWIATAGDAVFEIYRDAKHFSSRIVGIPEIKGRNPLLPIEADATDHTIYRKNIMPIFTSEAIETLGRSARELCIDLIEELKPQGGCEFVMDFAFRFPLGVFMRMMGLPDSDRIYLRRLAEGFAGDPDPVVKAEAFGKLQDYLNDAICDRIAHPRDDVITKVTQFRYGDRPYTQQEMCSTITLLCTAGLDTVAGFLAFVTNHLATCPDQVAHIRASLGDTTRMHKIVQELLRRFTVVSMSRVVANDYEFRGITMKEGDLILIPTAAFNMDPKRIDRPEDVDFDRPDTKHISFGSGPHTCAGALLAREEIKIFLEEWLTRIPEFRHDPERPAQVQALPLNQVTEMWLKW